MIQIIFIYNLIVNPQFIISQQTHHKEDYIEQISKNIKENIVLKIKEKEEAIQLLAMDRRSMVNYSYIIGRATRLMQRPSVIESPSDRLPERVSEWDLTRIETCCREEVFLVCPPTSWPPRCFLDVHSKSPGLRLFQK